MGRIERVNEQIKRDIGYIIQEELADPRLMFVSITQVFTSKDLRSARVYFSVLGEKNQIELAQNSLDKAKRVIRRELGARLKMRFVPELNFYYDESIEYGARVDAKLREIQDEP